MISKTEIYSGGKKLRTTQWDKGIRHGTDAFYDTSKNPVRVVVYDKGEISQISKGENLKLGPEYDYGSYSGNEAYKKTLPLKSFGIADYWRYDDTPGGVSAPKESIAIKKGVAEGMRKEYYEDLDRIEAATPYKSGRANGAARAYYFSGMLFSEIVFADGEKDGPAKYYKDRRRLLGKQPAKVLYFRRGMRTGATN
jgi:antitoxin component YwqK of YwqJK toxin-antitoxin module